MPSNPIFRDSSPPDSKLRFSDRVEEYVRYRPRYPDALLPLIRSETGLLPDWMVADIGSGTGISAEPFLANGNLVLGVEPNAEMRAAAEPALAQWRNFRSIAGSAENTTLPDQSVDLILAGQAFHWFDRSAARAEFMRIGRPGAWTVLVWNRRETESTPFLKAYEGLLDRFGTDYQRVRHDRMDETVFADFFQSAFKLCTMPNAQEFDYVGLSGRLLSSSYTPGPTDARRQPMLEELRRIFDAHQRNDVVRFEYVTEVVIGRLAQHG
ncbi:MAG: class I SAM-dependent methyltransferase [Gemmatimonadota bacterium]